MIGPGELLAGWNLLEKLGKLWGKLRGKAQAEPETIATRFIRLFETHGVHRNQIPRFFDHGLTLKDVQDDTSLIAKLDEPLLDAACKLFAVRREWLDGAETTVHPTHDFYKSPEDFVTFLDELIAANPEGELRGVLIAPEDGTWHAEALLILQEIIGSVGNKPIYRFHLCNNWFFTYWKSRGYLTACVAIAWKRKVYVTGVYMLKKEIHQLAYGETLLGWQGEGVWFMGHRKWYAEDMVLDPTTFLNGIDPEQNNFGIKSGLQLWLDLEEQGYMNARISSVVYPNPKQSFQQELAKYTV